MDLAQRHLRSLRAAAAGKIRPLILIYGNPDPDALASAWALREILRATGPTAAVAYTGEVGRLENEAMIALLRVPAVPLREPMLKHADLVALVDAQPEFFRAPPLPRCDIVIDHHPRKTSHAAPFADIRPHCGATSSILTEYLESAGLPIGSRLATALYYGIQTDSRSLQRGYAPTDRRALLLLDPKVNRVLLRRIEFSSYSLSRLDYFAVALARLRYARGVLYSNVGPVPQPDICVQIADFLIRVKEANWALVSGPVGKNLVIVFRCDGHKKDAGRTAEAAFGAIGSAGGHRTMGRAEIPQSALPDGILLTQNERVERFVISSLARVEKGFRPLLRSIQS